MISRRFASFRSYLGKNRETMFPTHDATWTSGPSFPKERPEPTERARPIDLAANVQEPKYPRITKPVEDDQRQLSGEIRCSAPLRIVLISGIPDPAAKYIVFRCRGVGILRSASMEWRSRVGNVGENPGEGTLTESLAE